MSLELWVGAPAARLGCEREADIVQHRVLHGDLQPLALAGATLLKQRTEDADAQRHAGAGVAERRLRTRGSGFELGKVQHPRAVEAGKRFGGGWHGFVSAAKIVSRRHSSVTAAN